MHLKAEHLHATGAFKLRGATNAVLLLSDEEAARGVVAHSSGNHASALARAAQQRGIRCTVVMPRGVPATKRAATEAAGADVVICDPTLEARAATVAALVAETGAVEIHPFDDPRVQAGQGTAALELLEAVPDDRPWWSRRSAAAGCCRARRSPPTASTRRSPCGAPSPPGPTMPSARWPPGTSCSTAPTDTIADGLVAQLSERTLAILQAHAVQVVTVTEEQIVEAMVRLARDAKQMVEPSGAVALAGLVQMVAQAERVPADVGVIVSGGNVDLDRWSALVTSGG